MTQQRYLIAKYTPDVRRMEPRNFGLILWTRHRVGLRFLPFQQIPFDADKKTYERWVDFWTEQCMETEIDMGRGRSVHRSDPGFLEAIQATQRGSFRLYDSGYVPERIRVADIQAVVDQLFNDLVSLPAVVQTVSKQNIRALAKRCKKLFHEAGLADRADFEMRKSRIPCNVGHVQREFPVNYRMGTRVEPLAVFHRVSLHDEKSIDAVSFMFEQLVKANRLKSKERCASLFDGDDTEPIPGAYDQIAQYSTPINVSAKESPRAVQTVAFGSCPV